MLASVGTLATAGWTALSTGYVTTETIMSHHTCMLGHNRQTNKQTSKQANKQTNKQTNKDKILLLQPHSIYTDQVCQLRSENLSVKAVILTPLINNQCLEEVLQKLTFAQVAKEPLPITET
jgi:hypothetical protein